MRVSVNIKIPRIVDAINSFLPCNAEYFGKQFFCMIEATGTELTFDEYGVSCTMFGNSVNGLVFNVYEIIGIGVGFGELDIFFNDGSRLTLSKDL